MNNKNDEKTPLLKTETTQSTTSAGSNWFKKKLKKMSFYTGFLLFLSAITLTAIASILSLTIWKKSSDDKDKSDNRVQENRRRRRRAQDIEDAKNELGTQDINLKRMQQLEATGKNGAEMTKNQAEATDKSNKSLANNLVEPARKLKIFQEKAGVAVKDAQDKVDAGRRRAGLKFDEAIEGGKMSGNAVRRKVEKAQRTIGKFV